MQCDLLAIYKIKDRFLQNTNPTNTSKLENIYSGKSRQNQIRAGLLDTIEVLNKPRKRITTLELLDPKIIRYIKKAATKTSSQENNENAIFKNSSVATEKTKKDLNHHTDKDHKLAKGKAKRKTLAHLEQETITSSNHLAGRRKNKYKLSHNQPVIEEESIQPQEINITGSMVIKDLAVLLNKTDIELIKFLFLQGIAVTINETIDIPTIELIAHNYNVKVNLQKESNNITPHKAIAMEQAGGLLEKRAPVVAVLGHVDHGKTSLLDQIRKTHIANEEAGGITQVLTAYNVQVPHNGKDEKIVLLDTPGHAAFTQMRSRGALIMDIAVLVIAADDILQPQTIESIQHIKEAKVPMIVAINKIDKETANINKIKEQLTEYEILSEDWGGDTIMVPLSALTGENISALLESILLVADIQNLQAYSDGNAKGVFIEAHMDKIKGVAATVLVQSGKLKKGDVIAAYTTIGKIKMMTDETQKAISSAGPSTIVKLWGFSEIPPVGSLFSIYDSEKEARNEIRNQGFNINSTNDKLKNKAPVFNLADSSLKKELKVLNLIIKSNTQGSLEAVLHILEQIPQNKVTLQILSASPGEITETDVTFASTTKALVLGFDTTFAPGAKQAATRLNVLTQEYQVIYDLVDNLEKYMCDLLDPEYDQDEIGLAKVKSVFPLARGKVAGCYVESGKLQANSSIQVIRKNESIYEGKLDSLKRVKEDVSEINSGNECGVLVRDFQDWEKDDLIKAFEFKRKKPSLA